MERTASSYFLANSPKFQAINLNEAKVEDIMTLNQFSEDQAKDIVKTASDRNRKFGSYANLVMVVGSLNKEKERSAKKIAELREKQYIVLR